MKIRVGIEGSREEVLTRAREIGAPILVSANSLWDDRRQKFRGWHVYRPFDTALDSGGFVAMNRYGRYRYSTEQYVSLAKAMVPTWWAQMDYCCEPEIAADSQTVAKRIDMTAKHLEECKRVAQAESTPPPLPVLQGWKPDDYCSGPIYDQDYDWPSLVGVGSVCRRHVNGPDGIVAVLRALDSALPSHVRLHLFGVKSTALRILLKEFPHRVASMDSMAWSMAARWRALESGESCNNEFRAGFMDRWYSKQRRIVDDQSGKPFQPRLL